ncbi:MAG: hypothetical protein ABIF40_02240 [archaeon]
MKELDDYHIIEIYIVDDPDDVLNFLLMDYFSPLDFKDSIDERYFFTKGGLFESITYYMQEPGYDFTPEEKGYHQNFGEPKSSIEIVLETSSNREYMVLREIIDFFRDKDISFYVTVFSEIDGEEDFIIGSTPYCEEFSLDFYDLIPDLFE